MPSRQKTDGALAPELEAIATAAAERQRAQTDGDTQRENELRRSVGEAASAAIVAGLPLGAMAEAERAGETRARAELSADVLRRVERAARRKQEADSEYEQAVVRAARLGLAHRDVAAAVRVAHGTVRAILTRTETTIDASASPRQWQGPTATTVISTPATDRIRSPQRERRASGRRERRWGETHRLRAGARRGLRRGELRGEDVKG